MNKGSIQNSLRGTKIQSKSITDDDKSFESVHERKEKINEPMQLLNNVPKSNDFKFSDGQRQFLRLTFDFDKKYGKDDDQEQDETQNLDRLGSKKGKGDKKGKVEKKGNIKKPIVSKGIKDDYSSEEVVPEEKLLKPDKKKTVIKKLLLKKEIKIEGQSTEEKHELTTTNQTHSQIKNNKIITKMSIDDADNVGNRNISTNNKEKTRIYREDNKEKLKQNRKVYYDENNEKLKHNRKVYYQSTKDKDSETFKCECGSECWATGKNRHFKSKKHQDFINQVK